MMRYAKFSVLGLLLAATTVLAQFEPQPEPGRVGLSATGRGFVSGKAALKRGDTSYEDVRLSGYELNLVQTFTLGKRETVKVGVEQQTTFIDQSRGGSGLAVPLPDDLKAVAFSGTYTRPVNEQWMISVRLGAGSYVGDSGLLAEGWGMNASVMGIFRADPGTTWIFGLAYSSLMSDLRVLPVVGFMWRPEQRWMVAVGFPKTAVTYHFSREFSLGVAVSGTGGVFKIKDEPASSASGHALAGSRLEQREVRLGIETNWKASSSVRLTGTVGSVLYRKFEYVDRDFELKQHGLAPFVSGAVTFSF